jgi:hypothetical protein
MTRSPQEDDGKNAAKPSRLEYPAEKARQGEIILRTPLRKAIFLGGLIAFVLLAVIFSMLSLR